MIYQNFWKQRSIPTWLALIVLISGIAGGVFVLQQPSLPFLQASPEITPQQVEISNITDQSFTVSWITAAPTTGLVKYGENNQISFVARDSRDPLSGELNSYTTHLVVVAGLNPVSSYSFTLQANGRAFINQGSPYTVTTGSTLSVSDTPATPSTFSGSVITDEGQPAAGALVYLRASNLSPLSTLVNPSGEWHLDLDDARTNELSDPFTFTSPTTALELFIQGGQQSNSTVAFISTNSQPLPAITLGQDYDFRSLAQPPTPTPANPAARFDLAPPLIAQQQPPTEGIIVWNPEPEEILTTDPLFLGSAPPGTTLNITLNTTPQTNEQTSTDDRGYWEWSPPQPLTSGPFTFTISYSSTDNQQFEQTRNFIIQSSNTNNQLAQTASPTPVLEVNPTATPTILPTNTPTLTPTIVPTIAITGLPSPTPTPAVPQAGFALPTVALTGFGLILMGVGVLLVL